MDIFKAFRESWAAYRRNFGTIVLAVLLMMVPVLLLSSLFVGSIFDFSEEKLEVFSEYMAMEMDDPYVLSSLMGEVNLGAMVAFLLVIFLVNTILFAGAYGVYLASVKGRPKISVFFDSARKYGLDLILARFVLGFLSLLLFIVFILILVGAVLIFSAIFSIISESLGLLVAALVSGIVWVGAILVLPLFLLVSPAVVSGKGAVGSIKESIELGRKNYIAVLLLGLSMLLLIVCMYLLMYVHFALYYIIGPFVISPFMAILTSYVYLDLKSGSKSTVRKVKRVLETKKIKSRPVRAVTSASKRKVSAAKKVSRTVAKKSVPKRRSTKK